MEKKSRLGNNPLNWIRSTVPSVQESTGKGKVEKSNPQEMRPTQEHLKKTLTKKKADDNKIKEGSLYPPYYLISLSAKTEGALQRKLIELLEWLKIEGNLHHLQNIAYTLSIGRSHFPIRIAFVIKDLKEFKYKLKEFTGAKDNKLNYFKSKEKLETEKSKVHHESLIAELEHVEYESEYKEILNKLAEYYIDGFSLDWRLLFKNQQCYRIPMPTYPFEQEKYWIDETKGLDMVQQATITSHLHSLVHTNTSTLTEQKFTTGIEGSEWYLAEEKDSNIKIIPHTVFLEMMRIAGEVAANNKISKIENIVWSNPITIQNHPVLINVKYFPSDLDIGVDVEVTSQNSEKEDVISQGKIILTEHNENQSLSSRSSGIVPWNEIMEKPIQSPETLVEWLNNGHMCKWVGKTVKSIRVCEDEALIEYSLPKDFTCKDELTLHPLLLDTAIQAAVWMIKKNSKSIDSGQYIPYSLKLIEINEALLKTGYIHLRRNQLGHFDILFSNKDGKVLVKWSGLELKPFRETSTQESPSITFYQKTWQKSKLAEMKDFNLEKIKSATNLILFDTDENAFLTYREAFPNMFLVKKGKHFAEIADHVYTINPTSSSDYDRLLNELDKKQHLPTRILFRWTEPIKEYHVENINDWIESGILSVSYLTQSFMKKGLGQEVKMLYMFSVQKENEQPIHSAISGFNKTIQQENPNFKYKSIEWVEKGSNDSQILSLDEVIREFEDRNEDLVIRYEDGVRFTEEYQECEVKEEASETTYLSLREKGVYIITGGLGGLGFHFARHLIQNYLAHVILVGRSELSDETESRLKELQTLKGTVTYIQTDLSNREEVKNLVVQIKEEYHKIHGILHCAGVIHDAYLLKKTKEQIIQVVAPKVLGLINLDHATQNENLDFLATFSSIAAVAGNAGQADYAFANAFMDSYAKLNSKLNTKRTIFSVNWPLWENGGMQMNEEDQKWLSKQTGLLPLPLREGIESWELVLRAGISQCAVVYGKGNGKSFIQGKRSKEMETESKREIVDPVVFRKDVANLLKEVFGEVMKLAPHQVDPKKSFMEYGIDSIFIKYFNQRIEQKLGPLPRTLLFEYKNLDDLTNYMVSHHDSKLDEYFRNEKNSIVVEDQESLKTEDQVWPKLISFANRTNTYRYSSSSKASTSMDIAVIGMDGRFPMAKNLDQFWENLKEGKDCITEVPKRRWDIDKYFDPDPDMANHGKMYSKWGGFLEDDDKFDPMFFNISPKEAELMDPQERIFLEVAWATLEDAGYSGSYLNKYFTGDQGFNIGVFAGVTTNTYQLLGPDEWKKGNMVIPNSLSWSIANRVSYILNLNGPSLPVDTACSSGLTAIHMACQSLKRGECQIAIAGGVNLYLHPIKYVGMSQMRMLSPTGRCHAFGADGDGFVPGEGVGALLLKPLNEAIKDNDQIYAVIKGSSLNHGGNTNGYTVPNPNAQADLIRNALEDAGVDARTISYVEAHGTGTSLGDPIEIAGLSKAFANYTSDKQYCSIGSIKSNIGHLESSAGIAGLIKIILQMKYQKLVPTLHCDKLNPNIDFSESPFYVQHQLKTWERPKLTLNNEQKTFPRRAGISSFGAGGSNAHIILEEYEGKEAKTVSQKQSHFLIPLSAQNRERLQEYVNRFIEYLERNQKSGKSNESSIENIAYTLQISRVEMEERLAILVTSLEELKAKLELFKTGAEDDTLIYAGNIKAKDSPLINQDIENSSYVDRLIQERKWEELAHQWVHGTSIDWSLLYDQNNNPKRISLPTYPFARERYWVPVAEEEIVNNNEEKYAVRLHPLVMTNTSTLREQKFSSFMTGREFYLHDHVIQGNKVLPGVAYLEMARIAAEIAGEQTVGKISNIIWARPIILTEEAINVDIGLYPHQDMVEFEITTTNENLERILHANGHIYFEDINDSNGSLSNMIPEVSLEDIRSRCVHLVEQDDYYQWYKKIGFTYGPTFQSIEELVFSRSEALARLQLPALLKEEFKQFGLHPSLMDGSLQTVAVLMNHSMDDTQDVVYLPFAMDEVEILRPLTTTCFAYATMKDFDQGDIKQFHIQIMDEKGNLLINIKNFAAKIMKKQETSKEEILSMIKKLHSGEIDVAEVEQFIGGDDPCKVSWTVARY